MKTKLILAALLCSTGAHAQFLTGGDLLQMMRSTDTREQAIAVGYVVGVSDTFNGVLSCPPSRQQAWPLFELVGKWLEANPQQHNKPADVAVAPLFRQAWPCTPKQEL